MIMPPEAKLADKAIPISFIVSMIISSNPWSHSYYISEDEASIVVSDS